VEPGDGGDDHGGGEAVDPDSGWDVGEGLVDGLAQVRAVAADFIRDIGHRLTTRCCHHRMHRHAISLGLLWSATASGSS
jgi:hypothetical protein